MSAWYLDPSADIEPMQIELIRRMPSFAIVGNLNETVIAFAISGIKQRHPQAMPTQVQVSDLLERALTKAML